MKTKIILIILITLINIALFSDEENIYNTYNDYNRYNKYNNYEETSEDKDFSRETNPYLVFGVPPWTKFKDVKKRYKKIKEKMKQNNLLNSLQFHRYKTAYEQIEQTYRKNDYKDKNFFDVIKTTIKNIFYYEFIIFAVLFVSWAIYKFNTFAALLVATFVSVDNVIPHWFPNGIFQYCFSFILTLIIYFRDYFLNGKKKEEDNKENENIISDNTGKRKRRRFEKIE
jgi:hypothetical protein